MALPVSGFRNQRDLLHFSQARIAPPLPVDVTSSAPASQEPDYFTHDQSETR